jgi:predicted TIM-barrel fold metal-dependent hydrolase
LLNPCLRRLLTVPRANPAGRISLYKVQAGDLREYMKSRISFLLCIVLAVNASGQQVPVKGIPPGYEIRMKRYVDSLRIIDTHEHLLDPEIIKKSFFLDFSLLFQQNGFDDLLSAGMPSSYYDKFFNDSISPLDKWNLIEPYWNNSFNTSFNRIIISSIRSLYGFDDLNASTVGPLSEKIRRVYETDWFNRILKDSCRIDYIIIDGNQLSPKGENILSARRFESWLNVRSKYTIDSIAIMQLDPIYTLEDFVKSLTIDFEKELKDGMSVVKIFSSYYRTLSFEKTETDAARKVFRSLLTGDEDLVISLRDAKPLQDYLMHHLMSLARKYRLPVAIHTGIQAGLGKIIGNSNPELLANLFNDYPDVNFVLYHGSYPFGGELSALAKNHRNVYIDLNWMYSISPTYSERYLNEWLEMVPVSRIMAFGGDCAVAENVYSELKLAKKIIVNVLSDKISEGYFSEAEARNVARMILHDNAARLYNLR